MGAYLLRVLIAFDQLVQAAFRFGKPGVTISARAGTAAAHGRSWGSWLSLALDELEPGHCAKAIRNDIARANAAIEELSAPDVAQWVHERLG